MPSNGILRLVRDEDSHTGMSAAILIKNVRPLRKNNGRTILAKANFTANFSVNCEGYKVRPRVTTLIECQLSPVQAKAARNKRQLDRAIAGSPMLK